MKTRTTTTKRHDWLVSWCQVGWLYAMYAIGVLMLCWLLVDWQDMQAAQRIAFVMAIALPAHVFEEDSAPSGFFYANNLSMGSKDPYVYPQNEATNMFTNLAAEVLFVVLAFVSPHWAYPVITLAATFGIAEAFMHTLKGAQTLPKLRAGGKTTIYDPGILTAYVILLPLSCVAIKWMTERTFDAAGFWWGIGLMLLVVVGFILVPFAINMRVRSKRFAFHDAAYYDRFIGKH
ncbi:MAG: hypothetical protein UHD09_07265 [Bifidobacterium sp.]|nr:hypothetical protein [Bifidobacterium sp.]